MSEKIVEIPSFNWKSLNDQDAYAKWRSAKLAATENIAKLPPVAVADLSNPSESERKELTRRCDITNFAYYAATDSVDDPENSAKTGFSDVGRFAAAFALSLRETHRSAEESGMVALQVSDSGTKRGYIPYSTHALKWHTDGYYNAPDKRISAFVLHCIRPAQSGGINQLLDPEILYIRLRDDSPEHIRALMHPAAMVIPENRESDGSLRPASVGPVFYGDAATGRLQMRYTARTRSIEWRSDSATRNAEACLRAHLEQGDPLMQQVRLAPGQGVLNNNVLHNRTSFQDGQDKDDSRLMIRVRFHRRVARSA